MGGLILQKTNSQTMPSGYTQVSYNTTQAKTTSLLTKNGNLIKNTSGRALLVQFSVNVVYTAKVAYTVRVSKPTDVSNAIIFAESDNTRSVTMSAPTVLMPDEEVQVETFNPGTLNDPRNIFSATVLGLASNVA